MYTLNEAATALRTMADQLSELQSLRLLYPPDSTDVLKALNVVREANGGNAVSLEIRFTAYSSDTIAVHFNLTDHGNKKAGIDIKSFDCKSLPECVRLALQRYQPAIEEKTTPEQAQAILQDAAAATNAEPIPF